MKYRIFLWSDCDRSCHGCCNKDWDLTSLAVFDLNDFNHCDEVMLTGGEPLLDANSLQKVLAVAKKIKDKKDVPVYVYTATSSYTLLAALVMSGLIDGITLTLHDQRDAENLFIINPYNADDFVRSGKTLRLNVFKGIKLPDYLSSHWVVKDNIEWIKNCPLPKDEVFVKWRW